MPVLMAFYNHGNILMEVSEEQLLSSWKEFFSTGTNWKELRPLIDNPVMVCQMKDVIDYRAMDYYQRRYRQSQEDGEL